MIGHNINNIIVSGEVILSDENSGQPLGGRGSPDPLGGGEDYCSIPRTLPPLSAFGLAPNERSWTGALDSD